MVVKKNKKTPQNAVLKILGHKRAMTLENLKNEAEIGLLGTTMGKTKPKYTVSRTIKNLLNGGFVESLLSDKKEYLRLTNIGKKKFLSGELVNGMLPIPATWDGFWRIIILDLPEDRKNEREAIRYLLKKAGFACIKNTVWVSPYPFEYFFTNIKKDLELTNEIIIIKTDSLDPDTEKTLIKTFKK